ncbi:TrmB family transcriptional regulator [Jiangella alba]|uniref:Sugar-specific transcriptional regulator TrmB n=1 Tax=Jiangella alba TaxID=561176 RepID=A0A1H5GWA6_9ACTN|nr:helix-turn-helix domain-containing protein [Jiangella alba]SEE20013.1 Sugar-specific transcriptional regulator TrmB [Jiangella alba]
MNTSATVAGLVDLGLTSYEARAYVALAGRRDATPAEVARLASVPRQRAYDVLATLAERGLVQQVPGQAVRYRAQPPDHVTDLLLAVRRRELDRLAQASTDVAGRLRSLFQRGQDHGHPFDYVEVLRDREHAVERVQQLWADARHEVLTFVHPPYLGASTPSTDAVPAGIVQRSIYETSILADPVMTERVRTWAALGEQIRLTTELPLKLTIVDGRSVAFNMPDSAEGDGSVTTLVVQHEALAATLKIAFESLWSTARTLDDVAAARSY